MNDILYCFVLGHVCIIAIWHMGVSVNQGLICTSSYEYVFGTSIFVQITVMFTYQEGEWFHCECCHGREPENEATTTTLLGLPSSLTWLLF